MQSQSETEWTTHRPRILVVDEDMEVPPRLAEELSRAGYAVRAARDGQEALRLFEAEQPDLIIADLAMPAMNTLAFLAAIKVRAPQTGLLALTPDPGLASSAGALRCGAFALLVKPVDPVALDRSVMQLLAHSRLVAENRRLVQEPESRVGARGGEPPAAPRRIIAAFDAIPDPLLVVNRELEIVAANEAATALFGVPTCELIGRRCDRELAARGDMDPDCPVPTTFATGRPASATLILQAPGGGQGRRTLDVSSYPLAPATGALHEAVVHLRGVPRSERTEEGPLAPRGRTNREEMIGILGHLAAGLAHDFNNQLTIIRGCAEFLLEETPPSDPRREDAQRIVATVDRGTRLIRQLLAFSRKQDTAFRSVSLTAVVHGLLPSLRPLLGERVLLRTRTASNLWPVRADESQIEQVVLNLVVNARDAMAVPGEPHPAGTLTFELANVELDEASPLCRSLAERVPPGSYVMLAVSDTGCGMTPAVQAQVFEPFFTTKESGRGTGLGLSTVLGIVKKHYGCIGYESEPGRGSTFRVFLPRDEAREEAPAEEPALPPAAARGGDTVTALVVEDDEDIREVVRRGLERVCHRVHEASDVEEAVAVAVAAGEPIQLLVTDMVMPGGTGLGLAERLRTTFPGLKVLFISGYFDGEAAVPGAPGTLFLQKPFGLDELARKASELLEGAGTPAPRPA